MSSDDSRWQARMTLMACNICTSAISPSLLSILALQPILFHTIVMEGHYMLCSIEEFS